MALTLPDVARLCRAFVAQHYSDRIVIDLVRSTAPASMTADILVTLYADGEARPPHSHLLQVRRTDPAAIAEDLASGLADAIRH